MATAQNIRTALEKVIFTDLKLGDTSRINYLLNDTIKGGWEPWLQVELAHRLLKDGKATDFVREQAYPAPDQAKISDLKLTWREQGVNCYVELKTQRSVANADVLQRFQLDMAKVAGLSQVTRQANVFLCAAVFKKSGVAFQALRDLWAADQTISVRRPTATMLQQNAWIENPSLWENVPSAARNSQNDFNTTIRAGDYLLISKGYPSL